MGTLSFVSTVTSDSDVDLTTLGAADWAAWQEIDTRTPGNRKSGGGSTISILSDIGTPDFGGYSGDPGTLSWTDGTPNAVDNTNGGGVYFGGLNNGFSFTAPASTGVRTLRCYFGAYDGVMRVRGSLSDSSATNISFPFSNTGGGSATRNYVEISYSSDSSSQTILVQVDLTTNNGSGNVAMRGVHVSAAASSGVTGTVNVTTADDTSAASGTTTILGTSSVTTANDTSSASGTTTVIGSVNVTTGNDTSTASGTTTVLGSASVTTADDVATASGTVGGAVDGSANITTGDDTSSASGTTTIIGSLAVTTGNDTSSATGNTTVTGTVSVTTGDDTATANGYVGEITGTVNVTTGNDICTAFGNTPSNDLFGGVAHFANLAEISRKKREQERNNEPVANDLTEVIQIPQEVREIVSKVVKTIPDDKQAKALRAELKALEIQYKAEYLDALKTEMIKNYLLIVQQKQQEEEQMVITMMLALIG